MRIYRLYATAAATSSNAASIQILKSGRIKCVQFDLNINTTTDDTQVVIALALLPGTTLVTNNTPGLVGQVSQYVNGIVSLAPANAVIYPDCPIALGDFLYMSTFVAGTGTYFAWIFVHVQE